jgi:hypothetical protein
MIRGRTYNETREKKRLTDERRKKETDINSTLRENHMRKVRKKETDERRKRERQKETDEKRKNIQ